MLFRKERRARRLPPLPDIAEAPAHPSERQKKKTTVAKEHTHSLRKDIAGKERRLWETAFSRVRIDIQGRGT